MMNLMVDLITLVMFTSDSASDVEKTGTGGTNSRGDEGVKFSIFHLPYAGSMKQNRVYTRVLADTDAYTREFI